MYFTLAQASGTAIEGGSAVGSAVGEVAASGNTPGAIAGILYDASITYPIIDKGIIKLPLPTAGDSALKGVVDSKGYFLSWSEVQSSAGSEVTVASTWLTINANTSIPIALAVGFNGSHLTFNLYNSAA